MTALSRRGWLSLGALALPLLAPGVAQADANLAAAPRPRRKVYIQPLGAPMNGSELDALETALRAFYEIEIARLQVVRLPKAAFYAPRRRYRAEKLLTFLDSLAPADAHRVVGVTASDISTTKGRYRDWGILGLAGIGERTCVLSSYRCRRRAKSAEHARIRFAKTAVHELGHTFGLRHCPHFGCLMEDGKGSVLTTDHEYDLCAESRARLLAAGYALASGPIPWPRP